MEKTQIKLQIARLKAYRGRAGQKGEGAKRLEGKYFQHCIEPCGSSEGRGRTVKVTIGGKKGKKKPDYRRNDSQGTDR